jgi:hypothetical protein
MSIDQTRPAATLDEFYNTFLPEPLRTAGERQAFYMKMGEMRGGDRAVEIARSLRLTCQSGQFFKGFVYGHSGVGKSTELYRVAAELEGEFIPFRFSVPVDLDASGFKPFDVLLVIAQLIMEDINRRYQDNELVVDLPEALLNDLYQWYASCKLTEKTTQGHDVSAEAEAGFSLGPFAKILTLAAKVKANLKYGRLREQEITEYHMRTLTDLLVLVNRLLDAATEIFATFEQQILVIGEDFDKPGVNSARVEELFLHHKNVLMALRTNLIFNLPIALTYSDKREQLPDNPMFVVFDAPVYEPSHLANETGRDALLDLLYKRANRDLFEPNQALRLVVASGGNLRDLFQMALAASDHAAIAGREQIAAEDTTHAILRLRKEFLDRMGSSPYDVTPISYEEKATRLLAIYHSEPGHDVADPVLHSLLRARLVQEFNGEGRFGLPPMMVDVLKRHTKLPEDAPGGSI